MGGDTVGPFSNLKGICKQGVRCLRRAVYRLLRRRRQSCIREIVSYAWSSAAQATSHFGAIPRSSRQTMPSKASSSGTSIAHVQLRAMIVSASNSTPRQTITNILQHMQPTSLSNIDPSLKKVPPWQVLHPSSLHGSHHYYLLVEDLPFLQRHLKPLTRLCRHDRKQVRYA
jgi:hypothetical protein